VLLTSRRAAVMGRTRDEASEDWPPWPRKRSDDAAAGGAGVSYLRSRVAKANNGGSLGRCPNGTRCDGTNQSSTSPTSCFRGMTAGPCCSAVIVAAGPIDLTRILWASWA